MSERWKPKYGEKYWYWLGPYAWETTWRRTILDKEIYAKGNVHPTKEAAEQWGKEQEEKK